VVTPVENLTRRHCHYEKRKQTSLFEASVEAQSGQLFRVVAKTEEWPAFKRISNMANNFDVTPKTNSIMVPMQKCHSNDWRPKNNLRVNRG
jgi:1,4-alpha-glucan branching enzyme